MEYENKKIMCYLQHRFGENCLSEIYKTLEKCSIDKNNKRFLVSSQIKVIDFDVLTSWLFDGDKPKSADSFTFCNDWIYLIEFKSGNIEKTDTLKNILTSVKGKIIDSESTILDKVVYNIPEIDEQRVRLKYYLVVSAKRLGIDANVYVLAKLSKGAETLTKSQNELISSISDFYKVKQSPSNHYDDIDVWFRDLFELNIEAEGIRDIDDFEI